MGSALEFKNWRFLFLTSFVGFRKTYFACQEQIKHLLFVFLSRDELKINLVAEFYPFFSDISVYPDSDLSGRPFRGSLSADVVPFSNVILYNR